MSQSDTEFWEKGLDQARAELANLKSAVDQGMVKTNSKDFSDLIPKAITNREEAIRIFEKGLELAKQRAAEGGR